VASVGLSARPRDLTAIYRHPQLLLRGLVAVNLVVPIVALAMVLILPIEPVVRAGIFTMAVSPLAVFAPGKMSKAGAKASEVISLYAALILAAFIIVPVTLAIVALLIPRAPIVTVAMLARPLGLLVFIPLLVGLAVGSLLPAMAKRLAPIANGLGTTAVFVALAIVVVQFADRLPGLVGDGTLLAIVTVIVSGLAAGHLLGGRDAAHRSALAVAAVTRHPGIAVTIVNQNYHDGRAVLAILLFLLTSMVIVAIYQFFFFGGASIADAGRRR